MNSTRTGHPIIIVFPNIASTYTVDKVQMYSHLRWCLHIQSGQDKASIITTMLRYITNFVLPRSRSPACYRPGLPVSLCRCQYPNPIVIFNGRISIWLIRCTRPITWIVWETFRVGSIITTFEHWWCRLRPKDPQATLVIRTAQVDSAEVNDRAAFVRWSTLMPAWIVTYGMPRQATNISVIQNGMGQFRKIRNRCNRSCGGAGPSPIINRGQNLWTLV